MKYMDDVQTTQEAVRWFTEFNNKDIRPDGGIYHVYLKGTDIEMDSCTGDELITLVWLKQWQCYAEKLRELLHQATGQPYDTTVWESCNDSE